MNRRDKNDEKQILADRVLLHKDCRSTRAQLLAFGLETNEGLWNKLTRTGGSERVQKRYDNEENERQETGAIHLPPIG